MRCQLTDNHPSEHVIVYVGRLGLEKQLRLLKPVVMHIPNCWLGIVGAGPDATSLRTHMEGTNTVFTGLLHGDELSSAFASADVFCMPSESETLGFVVLEAMASQIPCVAANAGGLPNLIHTGVDGFLVPPRDAKAFTRKVQYLLEHPHTRKKMGDLARREVKQFSWEDSMSALRNTHYPKALELFHQRNEKQKTSWTSLFCKFLRRLICSWDSNEIQNQKSE
eukprot:Platyproteum_vivax@DN505_c0_g1_i1.p2